VVRNTRFVNSIGYILPCRYYILPDRSALICKSGGTAWIVAPQYTQVSATWNGTTTELVGDKCCVCDWSSLCSCLISRGFNPSDWFVPSRTQLQNPGYVCRTNWDSFSSTSPGYCLLRSLVLRLRVDSTVILVAITAAVVRHSETVFVLSGV
jgi:hypothetical protein